MSLEPQPSGLLSKGPHSNDFLGSLTGLRFYAALAVFLSHLELFNYFFGVSQGPVLIFMKGLGSLGVSLFFVLSGFVLFINYLTPEKRPGFSLGQFYAARFARIYPMFFVATLFAFPLVVFSIEEPFPGFQLAANLTMLNSILPSVGFINIPAWTINVEAFFYALFPLLALLFRGQARRGVFIAFLAFALFRMATHLVFPGSEYLAADYFPPNRVLEFLTGMTLGYAYTRIPAEQWQTRFLPVSTPVWHALLAVLVLVMALRPVLDSLLADMIPFDSGRYYYYLYLPFSAGFIFLLALLDRHRLAPVLLNHPWIVLGGEISYAFYLLHRSVMLYAVRFLEQIDQVPTALPLPTGLLLGVFLFALCTSLSYAAYRWIEKPCRQLIRTRWDRLTENVKALRLVLNG